MHGYSIFDEYDYSIYLDGNLQIIGPLSDLIRSLGRYGLGFHSHPYAQDPYMEALSLSIRQKIDKKDAIETLRIFVDNGFPRHYGSVEGGLIVCDNRNQMARKILDSWFHEYMNGKAKRDQLYLPYVLYKMGIDVEDVHPFHCDLRENGRVRMAQTVHQK